MTTILTAQANGFVLALDDLGFGGDGSVSGADTVDVICHYEDLLRRLPALAELASAVDVAVNSAAHSQAALDNLRTAYQKLKGA